eukprot:404426-Hanusia_phi.AAC.1
MKIADALAAQAKRTEAATMLKVREESMSKFSMEHEIMRTADMGRVSQGAGGSDRVADEAGCKDEHCEREDSDEAFRSSNYDKTLTTPSAECLA